MQIIMGHNNNINPSFYAGSVNLRKIRAKNILHYDAIKKIAEEDNLDIYIKKLKESKYFPAQDFYLVYAKHEIDSFPFKVRGTSSAVVSKNAKIVEVSAKIYDAVINSVKCLAENIKTKTGTKPEFLKDLK